MRRISHRGGEPKLQQGYITLIIHLQDDNIFLRPITEASRRVKTESSSTKHVATLSLDTLLPRNRRSYYRYEGSLTTPPCSETVSWFLFYDQPTVSEAQMQLFR